MTPQRLVCVVEDDEPLRLALASLLRSVGYRTSNYESAEDFLKSPTVESASCIITDIQMPGLSGIELKQFLSARHVDTPVIMITARVEEEIRVRAKACGAFAFFRKPFESAALVESVDQAVQQPGTDESPLIP
jgi:FixJ family two-component response regulator